MPFYNPLQNKNLLFPKKYKDKVEGYCSTKPSGGKSEGPLFNPFKRQVDLWFLALSLGVKTGKRTKPKNSYRFIEGSVLANSSHIIEIIELIAISETKDPYIIGDTQKLTDIANEYAATGMDILFNAMKYRNNQEPFWNLVDYLKDNIAEEN